ERPPGRGAGAGRGGAGCEPLRRLHGAALPGVDPRAALRLEPLWTGSSRGGGLDVRGGEGRRHLHTPQAGAGGVPVEGRAGRPANRLAGRPPPAAGGRAGGGGEGGRAGDRGASAVAPQRAAIVSRGSGTAATGWGTGAGVNATPSRPKIFCT